MNEEVINDLYNNAVSKGYKKSREEFVSLLQSNDAVMNDMYSYVQSKGYKKGVDDFKELIGATVESPMAVASKKKEDSVSPFVDGGSELTRFDPTSGQVVQETPAFTQPQPEVKVPEQKLPEMSEFGYQVGKPLPAQKTAPLPKFVEEQLSTVTPELIGKTEENVVPQLKYQFGPLGFKFEETGFGDFMKATSPSGESIEISLDIIDPADRQKEANKLNAFLRKGTTTVKNLSTLQKQYVDANKKITSQKELDESLASINAEEAKVMARNAEFAKFQTSLEAERARLESVPPQQRNNPEYIARVNDFISRADQFTNDFEAFAKDADDLVKRGQQLNKSIGKYTEMKAQQGTWYGAGFNALVNKSFYEMAKGFSGVAIDFIGEIIPTKALMSQDDYEKNFIEQAKKEGVNVSEGQDFISITSQLDADTIARIENRVRDVAKKSVRGEVIGSLDKASKMAMESSGVSPEYYRSIEETLVGGALLGTLSSIPAMAGGPVMRTVLMGSQVLSGIDAEMDNDPEFADISQNERYLVKGPIAAAVAILENLGLSNLLNQKGFLNNLVLRALGKVGVGASYKTFGEVIQNEIGSAVGRGALTLGAGFLAEAETGALQEVADIGFKSIYNMAKEKEMFDTPDSVIQFIEQVGKAGLQEGIGAGVLAVPGSVSAAYTGKGFLGMDDAQFAMFEKMANDSNIQKGFVARLKSRINAGEITAAQGKDILDNYNNSISLFNSLPENLNMKGKKEAMNLLKERRDLETQIDGKDQALTVPQRNRINQINQQLTGLSETSAKEGQPTYKVDGKDVTVAEINELINTKSKDELLAMNIQIENDNEGVTERLQAVVGTPTAEATTFTEADRARKQELEEGIASARARGITIGENLTNELETLNKKEQDAIQEQAAGEVPVQSGATVSEEVAQGEPQAEPQGVTQEGLQEEVIPASIQPEIDTIEAQRRQELEANKAGLDKPYYLGETDGPTLREFINQEYDAKIEELKAKAAPQDVDVEGEVSLLEQLLAQEETAPTQAAGISVSSETDVNDLRNRTQSRSQQATTQEEKESANTRVKIIDTAKKALNTLRSVFPNVDIVIHDDEGSYNAAMSEVKGTAGSRGNFFIDTTPDGKTTGRIDINLSKANSRTVAHEIAHGILLKTFGDNKNLFNDFRTRMSKVLKGDVNQQLNDFADQYVDPATGELLDVNHEEFLAELTGILEQQEANVSVTTMQKVAALINEFVSKITGGKFKPFEDTKNTKDVVDFFNTISGAIREGNEIQQLNTQEPYSSGVAIPVSNPNEFVGKKFRSQLNIGDYKFPSGIDILRIANLPIKTLTELVRQYEGRVVIITSDATGYGVDRNGDPIFGGFGFASNKKNVDDGIGFASLGTGTVSGTYTAAEKAYGTGKTLVLVMIQPPHTTINNSYGAKYIIRGLKEIAASSKEELSKTKESIKTFIKESTSIQDELKKAKGLEKRLFDFIDSIDENTNIDEAVKEFLNDTTFTIRKLLGQGILFKNKDIRPDSSTTYSKIAFNNIGYNIYDFLKEYGDNTILTDDLILNDIGGYVVGGFELDVLPSNQREALIDEIQNKGIVHPLFNAKLPGTNHFRLDALYDVEENFAQYAVPDTQISISKEERDALVRELYKDDRFYLAKNRSIPLEERTYTHLTVPAKVEFKDTYLKPRGLLVETAPKVSTKVARGEGFIPKKGAAEQIAKGTFVSRSQLPGNDAQRVVNLGRANGLSEQAISTVLQKRGFTQEAIDAALGKAEPAAKKVEVTEEFAPGYNRVLNIIFGKDGIIAKSRERNRPEEGTLENVINYLGKTRVYINATDVQREAMVRNLRKEFKKREKAAPSAEKVVGKPKKKQVTVDEMAALKDQIKLEARAAREAKADLNTKRRMIADAIKKTATEGKIGVKKVEAMLKRLTSLNVDSPTVVNKFIDYAFKVFQDAEYASRLSKAKSLKSSINKISKNKEKFANLRDLGSKFVAIDPSMLTSTELVEYNEVAEKIYKSIQGSNLKGKGNLVDMVVEADANKYIDGVVEKQQKQMLEDSITEMSELLGVELTQEEYFKLMDSQNVDEQLNKKYNEADTRAAIEKSFDLYSTMIDESISSGKDLFTGEEVSYSNIQKKTIQEFIKMDINLLNTRAALEAVDALMNFMNNGSIAKMNAVLSKYKGQKNMIDALNDGVKSRIIKKYFSKGLGKVLLEQTANINILFERVFGGFTRGQKMEEAMGFADLVNGKAKGQKDADVIAEEYIDKYFKTKPNKKEFNTAENNIERGMGAFMSRNINGTDAEIKAEFQRRKDLILKVNANGERTGSIAELEKGNEQEVEKAKIYQQIYDKILSDSNTVEDVQSKMDKTNLEAIEFWQNKWRDKYQDLSDVALGIYNKVLDKDTNFTPDRYSKLSSSTSESTNLLNEDMAFLVNTGNSGLYKKETGVLMAPTRPKKLPTDPKSGEANRYIDLSFDSNNSNAMYDALVDINTAGAIRQIDAAMNSAAFRKIMANQDDANLVRSRINLYVNNIRNKNPFSNSELKNFTTRLNRISAIGVGQSLGGITQPIKQTIPIAVNTFINAGSLDVKSIFDKSKQDFINRSGRAIANRGIESRAQVSTLNKMVDEISKSRGEKLFKNIEMANQWVLKNFLVKWDVGIARASWMTYYQQSLKKQGINPNSIDYNTHEVNEKAANYAQRQVDRQQNVSDSDMAGEILSSKQPMTQVFTKMLMPFSSFRMNQSARLGSDLAVLTSLSSDFNDRKIAARSVVGFAFEMATFRILSAGILIAIYDIVKSYIVDDEDEEDREKKIDSLIKGQLTSTVADIFSPIPIGDPYVQAGASTLLESYQDMLDVEEEDRISIYSDSKKDMIQSLGTFGIAGGRALQLVEMSQLASGKGFKDNYNKTKYVSNDYREGLKKLFIPAIMSNIGLAPSEVNSIVRTTISEAKKNSSTNESGEKSRKSSGGSKTKLMNKTDMKRYNRELYDQMYGPDSPGYEVQQQVKELEKQQRDLEKSIKDQIYGVKD